MKKLIHTILALVFLSANTSASIRSEIMLDFNNHILSKNCIIVEDIMVKTNTSKSDCSPDFISKIIEIPLSEIENFLAFSMSWNTNTFERDALSIQYKFLETIDQEEEWLPIHEASHYQKVQKSKVSELVFANKNVKYIQLAISINDLNVELSDVVLQFYDPGNTEEKTPTNKNDGIEKNGVCPCPQPGYEGRLDWCPSGECTEHPDPTNTLVTHLIVHHSFGTNVSSDWAGVVRSIWDFHVNTRGWQDIGYQWLIAPNGVVYEGRKDDIIGAHFCGTNSGTMGVCVLGDFTDILPTGTATDKLVELLAWKTCERDIDPLGMGNHPSSGLLLNNISGHRDGVCSTECPGNAFYPQLPNVRQMVDDYINNDCNLPALEAPSNLVATVVNENAVKLTWQDNSDSESGFKIERSVMTNDSFEVIFSIIPNATSFTDDELEPNTMYYYRIRGFDGFSFSEYSNQYGITTVVVNVDQIEGTKITMYPNPIDNFLQLLIKSEQSRDLTLEVKDMKGRIHYKKEKVNIQVGSNHELINTSDLISGFYILTLYNEDKKASYKFIKK